MGIPNGTSWAMRSRPWRGRQVVTMDGIAHDVPRWDMIIASEILLGMTKAVYTANSIVQHGSLNRIDLQKLEELQCT